MMIYTLLFSAANAMLLYVSTEYEYIYTLEFDGTSFSQVAKTKAGDRPTWITLNSDRSQLFSVDEVSNPTAGLLGFNVADGGALTQFMHVNMTTWGACHAATNDKQVFVSDYGGVYDNTDICSQSLVQSFDFRNDTSHGPNPGRQEGSHPHMVGLYKDFAYGIDLGLDQINQWQVVDGKLNQIAEPLKTEAGAGPRHIAFHPTLPIAYVVNELFNTVQTYNIAADGSLSPVGNAVSTIPTGTNDNTAAEIHTTSDGKYLYVSNRGSSNTIATFTIDSTGLQLGLQGFTESGGSIPRQFELDSSDEWMVVANQGSDVVSMFQRSASDGSLKHVSDITIKGPTCAIFY